MTGCASDTGLFAEENGEVRLVVGSPTFKVEGGASLGRGGAIIPAKETFGPPASGDFIVGGWGNSRDTSGGLGATSSGFRDSKNK